MIKIGRKKAGKQGYLRVFIGACMMDCKRIANYITKECRDFL